MFGRRMHPVEKAVYSGGEVESELPHYCTSLSLHGGFLGTFEENGERVAAEKG